MSFFTDAAKYYKAEPHQIAAWEALEAKLPTFLLEEFKVAYRAAPRAPEPSPVVTPPSPAVFNNSWEGIYQCALIAGAKFPECVAAQWALESGYGKYLSGKNNFFGIKGKGTSKQTWEDYGQGTVYITAEFKDFATPLDCVEHLVTQWYKDYKSYKGVNRARSRNECAQLLKAEGYATDPNYVSKLISIMDKNA